MIIIQVFLCAVVLGLFIIKQYLVLHTMPNKESSFWVFLPLIWLQIHMIVGYITRSSFFVVAEVMKPSKENKLPRTIAFISGLALLPVLLWAAMAW